MSRLIEVEDLRKSFRPGVFGAPVEALRGVSFGVESGQCFGLLGRNGAGKTTTLKILTGLMRAGHGSAALLGRPVGDASVRRRLGYLPENPYFHEHLSPLEGLQLLGRLSGLTRTEVVVKGSALLERLGLEDAARRPLRGFSKGMRQRYGFAAALLNDPDLLLLDEPMSGLDPAGRHLVKEIIAHEHERGRTVLLCSHVLADIEELCDFVAVLNAGTIVRQGAIGDLLHQAPRAFELCVENTSPALRKRIAERATQVNLHGERMTVRIPGPEQGPALVAEILQEGGRVLALIPEQETLERWFVKLTAPETANDDAGTGVGGGVRQSAARVEQEATQCV